MFIFLFRLVSAPGLFIYLFFETYLPLPGFPAPSAPRESKRIVSTPTP